MIKLGEVCPDLNLQKQELEAQAVAGAKQAPRRSYRPRRLHLEFHPIHFPEPASISQAIERMENLTREILDIDAQLSAYKDTQSDKSAEWRGKAIKAKNARIGQKMLLRAWIKQQRELVMADSEVIASLFEERLRKDEHLPDLDSKSITRLVKLVRSVIRTHRLSGIQPGDDSKEGGE